MLYSQPSIRSMNRRKMFSFLAAAPVAGIGAVVAMKDAAAVPAPNGPVIGEVRWFFSHFDTPLFTSCDSSHTRSISPISDPGASHTHTLSYSAPAVPVTIPKQWDGKEWVSI